MLSGAIEFSEQCGEHQFLDFYNKRRELLGRQAENRNQQRNYKNLITYLNRRLFPDHHADDTPRERYDGEEAAFLAALAEDDGEEERNSDSNDGQQAD